jgi:nucleoside diphosphate kinase
MTVATVLLAPDTYLAGAQDKILMTLRSHGFRCMALRLVQLNSQTMNAIYHDAMSDRTRWSLEEVTRVWNTYETFYALAPSALVYLSHAREDATSVLTQLKGSARPEQAMEGTLRSAADAENVMMNLVHTADTPAHILRESSILLGETEAAAYFDVCAGRAPAPVAAALRADLDVRYVPGETRRSSTSFPWILNALRFRATQLLVARYGGNPRQALAVQRALREERDHLAAAPTSLQRMQAAQRANGHLAVGLDVLGRVSDRLRSALAALSEFASLSNCRDYRCLPALRESGLYISRLEATMLELHGAAFRPSRALNDFYGE